MNKYPYLLKLKRKLLKLLSVLQLIIEDVWSSSVNQFKRWFEYAISTYTTAIEWIKSEIARISINTSRWVIFWLTLTTAALSFLAVLSIPEISENISYLYSLNSQFVLIGGALTLFLIIGLISFTVNPILLIGKQSIHNKPSWFLYIFWSLVNSLFTLAVVSKYYEYSIPGNWQQYLVMVLVALTSKWFLESLTKPASYLNFLNFASGSVGNENDKLGFSTPAKNSAEGLFSLPGYVNVAGIYGGFGYGKSSYARMIVENFDNEKVLYTYISLTETNEAKDFSKLFAERWLETLSVRYPKIDMTSYLPYMDSILRESGNGIFSEILKVITSLNRGLVRTRAKYFDTFYEPKNRYTSDRVAKLFGNINDIEESLWVVMVDEIERAQFDEIYRIIEIVERFKSEGRSGLPIKLLFLFCISEPELEEYLNKFENSDPRVHLIKTFFYDDPKSISSRIFLPPVEPEVKLKYVLDLLNKVTDTEDLKLIGKDGEEIKNISAHRIGNPAREFKDHQGALEYIVATLQDSSPRTIGRVIYALEFFYNTFKDRLGVIDKKSIRFSDILALEYIKIEYPYLIDFFQKTIYILVYQSDSRGMSSYFIKKELEEKKLDLVGWVEQITGVTIPENEKENVRNLVGLVAYSYFDFIEKDYQRDIKYQYIGSTSYPEILADYLTLLSDGTQTSYRTNNRLYQEHKDSGKDVLTDILNADLLSYSRFIFEVSQRSIVNLHLGVLNEMSKRILSGKMSLDPMNIGDTVLHEVSYQFVFQLIAIVEKEKDTNNAPKSVETAYGYLKSVLSSKKVPTGTKFIILSSLVNNERGSGSSIHYRLEDAFKRFIKYYEADFRKLIKEVFIEADNRYLSGANVLYENEENFFYTMYQGWSGNPENTEEIKKIQNAAKRKLENYPEAIKLYWNKYPIGEGWETLDDVFENDRFFSVSDTNNPVYMQLDVLIDITKISKVNDPGILSKLKFWENVKSDSKLQGMSIIKADNTLKSFLIRNGYL
jgi:hypothetical protein